MGLTVHKNNITHPCIRREPPRCEQYQCGSISACRVPDPTLNSPLLPCPHILILFGMCYQATVSVNTPPGNFDRKPPQLCGKWDAITLCIPICSDNCARALSLYLLLCQYSYFYTVWNSACFVNNSCCGFSKQSTTYSLCVGSWTHNISSYSFSLFQAAIHHWTPPMICITEVAKEVPLLDLHTAYSVPSISCYCWQLSWSPSIDLSPWVKIRWGIEMDSISII